MYVCCLTCELGSLAERQYASFKEYIVHASDFVPFNTQILSSIWHMLSFREDYSSMESVSGKIKATSKIEASECAHSDALPTATSLVRSNCIVRSSKDSIRYCLSPVSFCRSRVSPSRVYLSRANVTHTAWMQVDYYMSTTPKAPAVQRRTSRSPSLGHPNDFSGIYRWLCGGSPL